VTSRYYNREIVANFDTQYSQLLKKRNVAFIDQYSTPDFDRLTSEDIAELDSISHVWSLGDRLYKLADEFYNDPTLWWIIAWYNRLPTEAHIKMGWVVDIPLPLEKMVELWGRERNG